jgi:hypothetical protein
MASDEREKEWLQQDQTFVTVTLDAGVFHWLFGIIESKHKTQRYASWIPWYQALVERAYEQFRAATNDNGEDMVPPERPRRRVIHRRVAKG